MSAEPKHTSPIDAAQPSGTARSSGGSGRLAIQVGACLGVALAYAVVRYHVFGGVAWSHLPLYTMNKAVALAAIALLAAAYVLRPPEAGKFGLAGFALALLHAMMSLSLLTPGNYPKLHAEGRLNFEGELAVLTGCVTMLLLILPAAASIPSVAESLGAQHWSLWQRAGTLGLACTMIHLTAMGFKGWLQPGTWPGGMPPITLISLILAAWPLLARCARRAGAR